MEFKQIISKFVYRIEEKPEGGFIARTNDPNAPAIEGATRAEVEQKIRDSVHSELGRQVPALKQLFDDHSINTSYHVEAKPDGGFTIRAADPAHQPIEASAQSNLGDLIASTFISHFIGKLPPDVSQKLMSQLSSGGVNVTVNRKLTVTTRDGSTLLSDDLASANTAQSTSSPVSPGEFGTSLSAPVESPALGYEKGGFGKFLRLLVIALAIAAIVYIILRLR